MDVMIAGDFGAIVALLLVFVMAGVPAIGAAKRNRAWDAAHPRKVKRDA